MSRKLTLLSTTLLCATGLLAQQDTLATKQLDDVIVTANKVAQKQNTTGKVVSVITKEQIEKSAGKSVAQVLNEQAGLVVNGALNNTGSVQTVYMRGASAGRTLILMDGIPLNEPSTITNDYDLNLFSINDVERIEICKGAQSTLYGSDAVAGVINIITVKSNVTKPFEGKATLSAGGLNTYKANIQLYGKLDKFTYTARYAKLTTSGVSSAYDSTGTKNFDKDGYDGNVANATMQFQASKQLSVKAFTMFSQYRSDIDAGPFVDKTAYFINNKSAISGAGFNFKNDIVTLVGNYQYTKLKRVYDDNYTAGAPYFSLNAYNAISQFAELYSNVKLGAGFTLLSGADYRYGSYNNDYKSVSSFGPYNSTFRDTSVSQTSMYASLSFIDAKKHLSVELGGRLNTHSRYNFNYTYTFNPAYNFNDNWRAFGSIATGFKAPGLYQLSINSKLLPEESINYEAGVQYQNKHINTRIVYFNRKIDNGIDYNYITFKYFNYIKQQVNGIEYELTVKPVEKLTVTANYTLLIGQETSQNRVTNQDTVTYDYLLRRPKHVANLTFGVQPLSKLYVSVTGKYVSNRKDVGGYAKADVGLDAYFIMAATASYEVNKLVKLFADAQNITNKQFFDVRGYNTLPALFNVGVSVNW
ncbi:TonB-dependent receptor plug domain-containing protein [Parasediminibacterium paludis]|uniref:TonB-dependent receptor plug domain-containing protein n=1 Tax=Parasediminibacterium paludis TaxID=908966 RepID=A0ABV8Q014_9BACT